MIKNRALLDKILAIVGTALVWLPVLSPVLFMLPRLGTGRRINFDFLMPAEFFPVALLGGGLLLWAALLARSRRAIIVWGLGIAVAVLAGGQALAVVTGLASGETEPTGIWWALVLASLGIYTLALVVLGAGGVLLIRDLNKKDRAVGD